MWFWIAAAALVAFCVAAMALWLRRTPGDSATDVAVYRDQLRELERDRARGTLGEDEAEAARVEVARRLLAADRAARAPRRAATGSPLVALVAMAALVPGIAVGTYLLIGAQGYPDLPLAARVERIEELRAARPGQDLAEAETPDRPVDADDELVAMVDQLRDVMRTRPDDPQGWRLLALNEAGLGNLEAAWRAQDRLVGLLGDEATGGDFADLAEMMIQAAGGYVSPQAERALAEALRREPGNGVARYYQGLMYAQGGRPDLAWPVWKRLLADSPEGAPWVEPVLMQIEDVSALAGDPTPLAELPRPRGPSMTDIEAAGDLTLDERMSMIEGMVGGLAARLADQGGPPEDWARLIGAYGVLGRTDAAAAVYQEARMVFEESPAALDTLFRAAERAGLSP
jgi:cytochrome c-type biogenesis protein CcmH